MQDNVPLGFYTQPLKSETGAWLAILTLQKIKLPRSELIHSLAQLSNLAVLTIGGGVSCGPDVGIDDDVVKAWSRHAVEDLEHRAFGALRVLNLCLQPSITLRVFGYLRQLPALAIVNMQGCGVRRPGKEELEPAGWRYRPEEMSSPFSEAGNVWGNPKMISWDVVSHRCLELADGMQKPSKVLPNAEEVPRLHLMLGRETGLLDDGGGSIDWDQAMVTFVRAFRGKENEVNEIAKGRKRRLGSVSGSLARKRPTFRASKERDLCGSLLQFTA